MQLPTPAAFRKFKLYSGAFMMCQAYTGTPVESFERQRAPGILVHFISQGAGVVDFFCYSVYVTGLPVAFSSRQAIDDIKSYFRVKVTDTDEITDAYFYSLTLPMPEDADQVKYDDIVRKEKEVKS